MAEGTDQYGPIATDEDGTVWKFVFTFCENDFDMDVEHGLPNYLRAKLFCKHCEATNSAIWGKNPYPMKDLRPSAKWRQHLIGCNSRFKSRILRQHPLTDSKYFNKYTARNDLMHCMDHHGVYGVIIASVIWFFCINNGKPSLGATQQERLDTVNRRLEAHYRETLSHPG